MTSIHLAYQDHPYTGWSREMLTQLILDPTHPSIVAMLPLNKHLLFQVERKSRQLCFSLHRARVEKLDNMK